MNKSLVILLIVAVVGFAVFVILNPDEKENHISPEEQEFNDSGQAKAILDETDLWMIYEGDGFTVKYPNDVDLNPTTGVGLYILAHENLDEPSPLPRFSVEGTLKTSQIDGTEVETLMTLGRFEVCSVVLEREIDFYQDDKKIMVVLKGDVDVLKEEYPEFFTEDEDNCGDSMVWNADKQLEFFNRLEKGEDETETQVWFNKFNSIINTIEFDNELMSIEGKWQSTDDNNTVVEFKDGKKYEYYSDELMFEEKYEITGDHLAAGDMEYTIVEVTSESLTLTYLPRGNTLKYKKI
jgi:hypothetical protein